MFFLFPDVLVYSCEHPKKQKNVVLTCWWNWFHDIPFSWRPQNKIWQNNCEHVKKWEKWSEWWLLCLYVWICLACSTAAVSMCGITAADLQLGVGPIGHVKAVTMRWTSDIFDLLLRMHEEQRGGTEKPVHGAPWTCGKLWVPTIGVGNPYSTYLGLLGCRIFWDVWQFGCFRCVFVLFVRLVVVDWSSLIGKPHMKRRYTILEHKVFQPVIYSNNLHKFNYFRID